MSEPRDSPLANQVNNESVLRIPLHDLHPFKNHPFRVVDDKRMDETVNSVRERGVLVPIIVRPLESGGFEIISGHRRKRACELADIDEIPAIVRHLDDDEATIIMVDSNLQRENILPSERAKAYQMKLEALKRQAERGRPPRDNSRQVGENSVTKVASDVGESERQVQRFIRLNNLEQPLMDKVDSGELAFTPAVELSYLSPEEQHTLIKECENTSVLPTLMQAKRMKKLSKSGNSSPAAIIAVMHEDEADDFAGIESSTETTAPTTGKVDGRLAHIGKPFERSDGFAFILEEIQVAEEFYIQEIRAASTHYTSVMQSKANTNAIRKALSKTLSMAFEAFNIKEE